MNKTWIFVDMRSQQYQDGVKYFIIVVIRNAGNVDRIKCPYVRCGNGEMLSSNFAKDHLFFNGVDKNHTNWFYHGKRIIGSTNGSIIKFKDNNELYGVKEEDDNLVEMVNDAEEYFFG